MSLCDFKCFSSQSYSRFNRYITASMALLSGKLTPIKLDFSDDANDIPGGEDLDLLTPDNSFLHLSPSIMTPNTSVDFPLSASTLTSCAGSDRKNRISRRRSSMLGSCLTPPPKHRRTSRQIKKDSQITRCSSQSPIPDSGKEIEVPDESPIPGSTSLGTPPTSSQKLGTDMCQLCLFEQPQTPNTLLKKAQEKLESSSSGSQSCSGDNQLFTTPVSYNNSYSQEEVDYSFEKFSSSSFRSKSRSRLQNAFTDSRVIHRRPSARNINPFTPDPVAYSRKYSSSLQPNLHQLSSHLERETKKVLEDGVGGSAEERSERRDSSSNSGSKPKKLVLRDSNISRYKQEFHEEALIGQGEFSSVYKVINRLDGLTYALKKSSRPVAGSVDEQAAMREVYAHAVLGVHPHIVRYYSAWAEEDHMLIQNEYCDGGSLTNKILENQQQGSIFSETELKDILFQVSKGLEYIHSMGLVHLDMKPGNIFVSYGHSRYSGASRNSEDSSQSGDSNERTDLSSQVEEGGAPRMSPFVNKLKPTYKIGDMGHVTSAKKAHKVEEGDVRYLALEILQEKYQHIKKADVFSLAMTIFEAGGGGPLPKNGQEWHSIRNNKLGKLERYSADLNSLISEMTNSDPTKRPSSKELNDHPFLCPTEELSVAQLRRELNQERFKNEVLLKKLEEATRKCASLPLTKPADSVRVSGRVKFHRSKSFTDFPSFPLT